MGQTISHLFGPGRFYGERHDLPFYYGMSNGVEMNRHVIVTGGSIVPFEELLLEVATPHFLSVLRAHGFTHIHLQCNNFVGEMQKRLSEMDEKDLYGLEIDVFNFDMHLKENIQLFCRGQAGGKPAGIVIGHAGTGTIADAYESGVALVIVANPNLMDNHQAAFSVEVVKEFDNLVLGHLGRVVETIPQVMDLIEQQHLDHLGPLGEVVLPVDPDQTFGLIDLVIASNL